MRRLILTLPFIFAFPVHAETPTNETLSAEIGRTGLSATEARLSALPNPTDEDRFTMGGVQFLRAVEISFQIRWRYGMTDPTGMVPFLRLPLEDNPTPAAFDPTSIRTIFQQASDQLDLAKASLTAIPETSDFGAVIALDDIWLDVNANTLREPDEALMALLAPSLGWDTSPDAPIPALTIRFDVADASWLAAYADMLNAASHMVLAYDPTQPIIKVLAARAAMDKLGPVNEDMFFGGRHVPDSFDILAMVLATLNQPPDRVHITAVQTHLQAMVDENRQFWTRVAVETDDVQEWLPNPRQHAAMGIEVPPDAGPKWLYVLDQVEAILQGKQLVPFWRVGPPAGLNMAKFFADPAPIDVAGWIQGWAALPYLQTGTLASPDAIDAFDQATMGRSMLFALYFN